MKRPRDARLDEILKGDHGPANLPGQGDVMTNLLSALRKLMPGWEFTLFAFEPPDRAKADGRLPRLNYGSTVERADMLAVLEAFILKNKDPAEYARMAKLDEFRTNQTTEGKS
jgi:hypothetical protein